MQQILIIIVMLVGLTCIRAQPTGDVPLPVMAGDTADRVIVYVGPNGRQTALGTREDPVASFTPAMELLKERTTSRAGSVACALVFLPGRYRLSEPYIQFAGNHSVTGPAGTRTLQVSFVGEGSVTLDASGITVPAGHGVITPSGSGIEIRNIRIVNSSEFGIRLGTASRRATNVRLIDVEVDSTFSHGILVGDAASPLADTTALIGCKITNTNLMNVRGSTGQFGSALKMFGAREVNVINCRIGRNWGEAVCINNSSRVRVAGCTIYDNWAPGVYCDAGQDVVVSRCEFRSANDTAMFPAGRRGMVGVLISTEAWTGSPSELRSGDIDIVNNVFINMAGCLDVWEGTASFVQRQMIENVRFVHNTCIGMWTTTGNTSTAFVNLVYSIPFPTNRAIRSMVVSNNIFSVNPAQVAPNRWIRMPAQAVSAFSYPSNIWSASVPGISTTFGNVVDPALPLAEPASLLPEMTPALRHRVPSLPWVMTDADGRPRAGDSTNAGAYEWVMPTSVDQLPVSQGARLHAVFGSCALVCASDRSSVVEVYGADGRILTTAWLQGGECQTVAWRTMQAAFVRISPMPGE